MTQKSKFYMEVRALHSEVTGSCYICKMRFTNGEKRLFLVDLGMFQEKDYSEQNENLTFNPEDVCFTLVTHNHVDHVGRLPLLYKRGCKSNIYCTNCTAQALPINLEDSAKIMAERAKRQKKSALKANGRGKYGYRNQEITHTHYTPLYTESDVEKVMEYVTPVEYGEWCVDFNLPQVRFKFFPNAHLPGAAIIWIQVSDEDSEEINFLFIGDWHNSNLFQGKYEFPEELRNVPLHIVTESTYGSTYSNEITKTFRKNILEQVANGKKILLPVISQYRAQEILWYLKDMKEKNEIPKELPIYFCGSLGLQYITLYQKEEFTDVKQEMKDFVPSCTTLFELKRLFESELSEGVYVVTGGMGSNGPSNPFLLRMLPDSNVFVQFSSYCAEGTLGEKLKETEHEEEIMISGVPVKKSAQVAFTSEFSGHAKADELLEFLSGFQNIKTILVAHGNFVAKQSFLELLLKADIAKEVVTMDRENYFRLNRWGIIEEKVWSDYM